ncbi:MAG: PilZ domain-containing protein [Hyphomicrobiales bacterium]|nr:PilZ domain-containing protein [Hyphomicrobiales bacterium]
MAEHARVADEAADAAAAASGQMAEIVRRHGRRATVFLSEAFEGERRKSERLPARLHGFVEMSGETVAVETLDLSRGGALLRCPGGRWIKGAQARLLLRDVGSIDIRVVGVSELGVHAKFLAMAESDSRRVDALLAKLRDEHEPFMRLARAGADAAAKAMEGGLARGEVFLEELITSRYAPIPETEPIQYETQALSFYERHFPAIIEPYYEMKPEPVVAVLSDRNGYLPVHHPRYSLPQQIGQTHWNDLNSRNKRIMDKWQSLAASRNRHLFHVRIFLREMSDGQTVVIKNYCAPIFVRGFHWGNMVVGFSI